MPKQKLLKIHEYMTPDKPYNRCITCGKIGVNCDGPNFLAMSGDRWMEWVKLRKEYLGWSNADIADQSQVSKTTVDRIFSGHGGDLRISTMEAITKALVNGTWGQFPCADPGGDLSSEYLKTIEEQKEKIASLYEEITAAHAERRSQEAYVNESQQKKVDFLTNLSEERKCRIMFCEDVIKRNEKTINTYRKLVALLVVLFFAGLIALIIDLAGGDIGWFRY